MCDILTRQFLDEYSDIITSESRDLVDITLSEEIYNRINREADRLNTTPDRVLRAVLNYYLEDQDEEMLRHMKRSKQSREDVSQKDGHQKRNPDR